MTSEAPTPGKGPPLRAPGPASLPPELDAEWMHHALLAGGVGLFTVDIAAQLIYPSAGCCALFGLPVRPSYPTKVFEELLIAEDRDKASSHSSRTAGSAELQVEYRIARADTGEVRVLERRAAAISSNGVPVKFVGTVRDITAQRRAEADAARRAEALNAFSRSREFIVTLTAAQRNEADPDRIMRLTAEALSRWLEVDRVGFFRLISADQTQYMGGFSNGAIPLLKGVSHAALFGTRSRIARSVGQLLSFSDSRHDVEGGLEKFADQGVLSGVSVPLQSNHRWHAGMYAHHASVRLWTKAEVDLIQEVAALAWQAVERAEALLRLRDRVGRQQEQLSDSISDANQQRAEREEAESKVRQLQKMESVGLLTGGIAHDFNNMLAVILGALTLTQRKLAKGQLEVTHHIDTAIDSARRAAALTARLLSFARQQPLAPEPLDANRLVAGMSELLTRSLGEQVQLETIECAGLWMTMADPHQLENVLLNLAVNARDAMPEGGKLTIETGNVLVSEPYAQEFDVPEGHYVRIAVSDTGTGMTPEVLEKAFDPFFTTKAVGKGSGLGLSQVYGFASQSGGHVKVYSEVGHGTTFKMYLPRYWGEGVPPQARPEVLARTRRGDASEVVMVVEDDERLRAISVEVLRDLGYTVVHAAGGPEALALMQAGQKVSLLFTDVVMPEMTGRVLADQALKLLPGLKVVFTTGYTRNAIVHNGTLDVGTHLLVKPFTVEELARKIGSVMQE